MQTSRTAVAPWTSSALARRVAAVLGGVVLVALGAQVAVPLPGTPVPFTLQVPAVLVVGGLLGPRLGALSLALYLMAGAAGLPVFAPVGAPGAARLLGPTGGYLLAYPLAAAVVGWVASGPTLTRLGGAVVAGLAVIHLGGIAQLAILGGDLSLAVRLGSLPFLAVDLGKLVLAVLLIRKFSERLRALL